MAATRAAVECPHCGEPTLPNRLMDGTVVCSCAAERDLPAPSISQKSPEGAGN